MMINTSIIIFIIQETSYLYSRLSIHFISCSTATCA